jgi:hypothetical protein
MAEEKPSFVKRGCAKYIVTLISGSHVSSFNPWSLLFAALVALAAMTVWHIIRARGEHEQPTFRRSY